MSSAFALSPTRRPTGTRAGALVRVHRDLVAGLPAHPERFVRKPPEPPKLPSGSWINKPDNTEEATQ